MPEEIIKNLDYELREIISKIVSKVDQLYYGILEEMDESEKRTYLGELKKITSLLYDNLTQSIVKKAVEINEMKKVIEEYAKAIDKERKKTESILLSILPENILTELKTYGWVEPKKIKNTIIIFIDIVGFTKISENYQPSELLTMLDEFFSICDNNTKRYGFERIKLIGDCYMTAFFDAQKEDVVNSILMCYSIIENMQNSVTGFNFSVRIGINIGEVIAGIAGSQRFAYDIWGDSVNIASRIQSASLPDKINISEDVYKFIENEFIFIDRGEVEVKNKNKKLKMYFVERK